MQSTAIISNVFAAVRIIPASAALGLLLGLLLLTLLPGSLGQVV